MRRLIVIIFMALVATVAPAPAQVGPATAPSTHQLRIALAGDSTVTDKAGWGKGFADSFTSDVEVINLAKGGRASGSFVREGRWQKVLDLKPDYVLVQFGHNDQPGHGPARETDPQTTYRANMTRYVDEARAAGIKVVLVTSMSRRQWGNDGKIHSTLVPWVDVVKSIAAEKAVPLIDLHSKSIEVYERLGKEEIFKISPGKVASTAPANGDDSAALNAGYDGTHLNAKGSALVGPIVAGELVKVVPALAPYLRAARGKTITVAADGSGDFKTIQEAVAAAPDSSDETTVIHIKPGTYEGQVIVSKNKRKLTFLGEQAEKTILLWSHNVQEPIAKGADKFNPGVQIAADDFRAENVTFRNSSGDHGQALALRVDSDRAAFINCRMLGWQDTLMVNNGRQYFKDCYIEGRVDFIYGSGTAVFEGCHIHNKNGGYVTAASTPQDHPFGFVFLHCKLTGDDVAWDPASTNPATTQKAARPNKLAYLGRPWREYAAVTFINCEMGDHIRPEGWHNWGKPEREKTARYAEYGTRGPGAAAASRVPWARQLTKEEADKISITLVLAGKDNWDPTR